MFKKQCALFVYLQVKELLFCLGYKRMTIPEVVQGGRLNWL